MSRPAIVVLLALVALFAPAPRASACSAPYCTPASFLPRSASDGELPVLPENGARVALRSTGGPADSSTITASRLRDGATLEVALSAEGGVVTLPDARAGDVWTITEEHTCGEGELSATGATSVRIGAAAEAPSTLGTLHADPAVRGEFGVLDASGPCSSTIDGVTAIVTVELDPTVSPWRDALRYETLVDGAPYLGPVSNAGDGPQGEVTRVSVACEAPTPGQYPPDLEEGVHLVQRRAFLPGSETPLLSDEIEIELRCAPTDPEVPTDPEDPADPEDPEAMDPTEPAPACSAVPGARGAGTIGLGMLAALALLRRRRAASPRG